MESSAMEDTPTVSPEPIDGWRLRNTFRSTSGEVRWDRFGNPEGEPLVLLHGTPFSSFIWRGVARALAPHHLVYVWDMPGYGQSEKGPDQDLSLGAMGQVFADLLDHWGLTEPLVAAHDSGGAVALRGHLVHGIPYRRLALVDAVAVPPWGSQFFQLMGEYAGIFEQLPPGLHTALVREYVRSASGPGLHPAALDALAGPWLGEVGQPAFYRQITARGGDLPYVETMLDDYRRISIPVLVCWGEQDTWIPQDRGRELAAAIPGAALRTVPSAGHVLPEDAPAELTAALLAFLHGLG